MRHELDQYDSPHWFLTHLPNYLSISGTVGEPCAGTGNLSNLLLHYPGVTKVWTNDIHPKMNTDFCLDAKNRLHWERMPSADWIITNPPFVDGYSILRKAIHHAKIGVVFFLRLSFIEPTEERGDWLFANPRYLDLIYPRFKFRKGKKGTWQTDSTPIAAFVWRKDTKETRGSITVPKHHIIGFHDNPKNAPDFEKQIYYLKLSAETHNNRLVT